MNESFETKLISSFKRHFILIVIISLLTGGGFYAYKSKTYVPMYSAKSTILVINKDKKGRNLNSLKKDKMLLDVYARLEILDAGVISALDMTPETTYVKLCWALGQSDDYNNVKKIMQTNIAGEFSEKSSIKDFLN